MAPCLQVTERAVAPLLIGPAQLPGEMSGLGLAANFSCPPCVDGSPLARVVLNVLQSWSVRPCVRPDDAALNDRRP
jgi:hypothetical protein